MSNMLNLKIGNISKVYAGGTPSRKHPEYWGGTIPWVKTTHIQNCFIEKGDIDETITDIGLKSSSAKIVPEGTILMAMIGQGKTRGQVAILNVEAAINQNCVAIVLNEEIDRDYVWHQLRYRYHKIRNSSNSSGQQNLNGEIIKGIILPFPDYEQQRRIGEILNQWDTAIEKTEVLIDAKERQFGWFCSSLIEQILPTGNPKVLLSDIYEFKKGAGLSKADIKEDGHNKCVLYGQLYTTYGEVIEKVVSRTDKDNGIRSKHGDILIPASTTTSAIDLANVTALLEDNVLLSGDINILRPKSKCVSSEFMAYYLTHYKKHELARLAQGITIIHLYGKDIKSVSVCIPDINMQNKVVGLLNTAHYEISLLKKLLEQYRMQKRGLMQKLLNGEWKVINNG